MIVQRPVDPFVGRTRKRRRWHISWTDVDLSLSVLDMVTTNVSSGGGSWVTGWAAAHPKFSEKTILAL
jgi:hypothetical protein